MKLSLLWLFDHIDADWQSIDVAVLVAKFNQTTAEIEACEKITLDFDSLFLGIAKTVSSAYVIVEIPELKQTVQIPFPDGIKPGQLCMIYKRQNGYDWATLADLGSSKEGRVPALSCELSLLEGGWKKLVAPYDYIIHLDNKSVNHRPDMWGHRGVAREVAAMLGLPLRSLENNLITPEIKNYEHEVPANVGNPVAIRVENNDCKFFAALSAEGVTNKPSVWWVALRLARVDSKPINAIVDATNFVMLDIGQPMHAFDASAIAGSSVVVRSAKNKETLALLDGQTIALTADDCIIADSKKPLSLAGIMGGKESGVSLQTNTLFIESGCFDATAIRKSSARAKKRTESSARYEKSLDPYQTVVAIQRFLYHLAEIGVAYTLASNLAAIGTLPAIKEIIVAHEMIEKRLGISISTEFVQKTLRALQFGLEYRDGLYYIIVPPYRATKDIAMPQDIIEEVGRFYGYSAIADELPFRQTNPFSIAQVKRVRDTKRLLAYGLMMQELYTYAFFDESFLQSIDWQPGKTLQVQDPVSANWQRLVTTLIPNLFKVVQTYAQQRDHMSFFEWARIWPEDTNLQEQDSLAGIFVDQKHPIDFYEAKNSINRIFSAIGITPEWVKVTQQLPPWYLGYQTANLMYAGRKIGIAGMADPVYFSKIASGNAFIFELDAEFIRSYQIPVTRYTAVHKYPSIARDVSMLVPRAVTVAQVTDLIAKSNPLITDVTLIDFFEKAEWKDQKSLTVRILMQDAHKTMTTQDADLIMLTVVKQMHAIGATIR